VPDGLAPICSRRPLPLAALYDGAPSGGSSAAPRTPDGEESYPLALPYDMPSTVPPRYQPQTVAFTLHTLHQAAGTEALPADGNIALAGLIALLHRYTQQTTLRVGVVNDRGAVATLVIEVHGEEPGASVARALARQLQELSRTPLDHRTEQPRLTLAVAADVSKPPPANANGGGSDLHLALSADATEGVATYNELLFLPATIRRLLGHWDVITQALARSPSCPIAQLPLLTPGEIDQLLVAWRPAPRRYAERPLFHEISRHAETRPDAIAVSFRNLTLRYGELEAQSNRLAHALRRRGVEPGSAVAVCIEPALDIAVCLLGIFKAGGAFVPLDPSYPRERQAAILEDVQARVLLTQSHLRPRLPPGATTVLAIDGHSSPALRDEPTYLPDVFIGCDSAAFIVYTSGTTGKPKGVITTHGNLVNAISVAKERYQFGPTDVQPAMARFSFSITMFELLSPLVAGGRLIVLERDHVLDFRRLLATLEESTVLHASPSLLRRLIAYIREQGCDVARLDGLRHVSSGGDMVAADLLEAMKLTFRRAELFVIYGCSEVACMACTYEVPHQRGAARGRIGRPFPNVAIRICQANGDLTPIGIPGEIYVGGAGVGTGYLHLPDLTRARFLSIDGERYYRTGDIGRYDADGEVEMLGRSDFQIKLRGIRIELGEIEANLRKLPGVREAVVMARELHGEMALVAYVVLEPRAPPSVAELRRSLQSQLPDYMMPAAFVVLEALPVNLNQKVDRRALPPPDENALARERTLVKARDVCEEKLLAIWRTLLHSEAIGVEDSFFAVGGSSLLAVSLMVAIEEQFGKALPLSTLLTEPTVAGLARVLRAQPEQERPTVVLLRAGGTRAPVFFVHDGEGEILPYRTLARKLGPDHPVYGIQPKSRSAYPMLHSRLADIVDDYTQEIMRIAPTGPYLLSGLCIGGFIAFAIASRLRDMGRTVAMVALIDVAHVRARPRGLTAQRLRRYSTAFKNEQGASPADRLAALVRLTSHKVANLVRYEASSRYQHLHNHVRMRLFRVFLDRGWRLPAFLANIPVDVVLRFAEKEYVEPEPYPGEVLLFRATRKSDALAGTLIDDTPYVDLFQDRHLGWEGKTTRGFIPIDIPAGHSSMLQEPHVGRIAEAMQAYIDAAIVPQGL